MKQTLQSLLTGGRRLLEGAKVPEPELDAKYLLLEAFRTDPVHFLMDRCRELPEDERILEMAERYRQMIQMRMRRIPLQQILGTQAFMGLTFFVDRHVLVPRQDTEALVELVLKEHPGDGEAVLDLCTGSGCIAISLALLGRYGKVVGVDLSPKALKVAARNRGQLLQQEQAEWREQTVWQEQAERREQTRRQEQAERWEQTGRQEQAEQREQTGRQEQAERREQTGRQEQAERRQQPGRRACPVELLEGDLFSPFAPGRDVFDILTANPPYIPTQVIEGLEPEVKDHEPRMALDGSEDGLAFYRRIASESGAYLDKGAAVYLEIGYDQGAAVCQILERAGFTELRVVKDAAGNDRVAAARWLGESAL